MIVVTFSSWSAASVREPPRLCFERLHVGSYSRMSEAAHDGTAGFLARNPETADLAGATSH
jgi:hypothetical protein